MTMAPLDPEPPDEDHDPSTTHPAKRKTTANGTPRRASAAKGDSNGISPKPSSGTTTPMRKASAQNKTKTPNTAPARARTGAKKAEPTLLGDFLLGRPSPTRNRRKSVDVVKAEMRENLVGKVQPPGAVKDRVKTWQKANAAAIIIDPLADAASQPDDVGGWENEDDTSVDEEERLRIKFREAKKTNARRKSKEGPEIPKHIPNAAPPKRVISDSHWMKQKKKSPPRSGAALPKNFLQTTSANPTVDKKISDWVKRTESEDSGVEKPKEKPRSRKTSRIDLLGNENRTKSPRDTTLDDGIRIKPSPGHSHDDGIRIRAGGNSPADDGIRVTPSKRRPRSKETQDDSEKEDFQHSASRSRSKGRRSNRSEDDGLRVQPKNDAQHDGIRVKPLRADSVDDGIRVKPLRQKSAHGSTRKDHLDDSSSSGKRTGQNLRIPSDATTKRKTSSHVVSESNVPEDQSSIVSKSPSRNLRYQKQTAQTPPESLADIPFGNSAFSVVELPLGAEAGNTVKRPPPKRNPSFGGVPKALKKVFNEGMKIAHDTVEPPRGGQNHPPSIESWLKGTSDPFVDKPGSPKSTLDVPDSSSTSSRKVSYNKDDLSEKGFTINHDIKKPRNRREQESDGGTEVSADDVSPIETRKTRETLPSMAPVSPLASPGGLKRTPATRNTSSPKTAKKVPLKDAFMDAFRGESSTSHPRKMSNPFLDITGLREREVVTNPRTADQRIARDFGDEALDETPTKRSPKLERAASEEVKREKPLPAFARRTAPTTGTHRLSTILSEVSYSTSSSATGTDTGSEVSQTTVTQDTVLTGPTTSSLSRSTHRSNKSGLKRRLTKHSDLVSMLSLPDAVEPARKQSIRSARSIRTTRNHLETATVQDLMRELVEDETKYKRELKTLVDGVIPVLLTCVLSKSDSALAAGLFNPHRDPSQDSAITKPIVDMGVALERLKSLHNRIPLADADAFISWAQSAHRTYEDYLSAWRAGFQDVVVNLEPATSDKQLAIDEIERDENGDAVGANGERADVAYFLKRPLVRVKFLARTTKGLSNLMKTAKSQKVEEQYQELAQTARRRHKEESARLEDEKANNTDPTRARDPRTLDLVDGVKIDRTRQVCAKDIFHLDLEHSTGQRVGCRVELVLRDKPDDEGDVLICEMDELRRFLLFPPIAKSSISARLGDGKDQVIIMIRGVVDNKEWHELLLLEADDPEAAEEWVELLGSVPLPPPIETIIDSGQQLDALVSSVGIWQDRRQHLMSGGLGLKDIQIPIGERLRRGEEEIAEPSTPDRKRVSQRRAPASFGSLPTSITEESLLSEPVVDLNDAMNKAGSLSTPKRPRAARYHDRSSPIRPSTPKDSADLSSEHSTPTQSREDMKSLEASQRDQDRFGPREVNVPKIRASSTPASPETAKSSTPLKEYMRPQSSPTTPTQQDSPPPPPPHRSPTPKALKKAPVLDTKAARNLNRRTSSPLKHEYQPSDASGTSSAEDSDSETDSTGSYSESSDDEELESVQEAGPVPIYGKRVSPSGSIYSLPNTTLAPSNSASQGPYRKAPVQCDAKDTERHTVMSLSYWNEKGQWVDIYSGPCSLIIGPGWLRAYKMDDYHSNPYQDRPYSSSGSADVDHRSDAATPLPLIAQELTPNVFMQRHTIDIHVRSPPMAESTLKCKGTTVRYHMLTPVACVQLYQSLYESSKNNMTYNKLEEERRINAYGTYGAAVPNNRRNSWFGRRNSYRASARAPSEMVSEQSGRSSQSRMSALRLRLSGGSIFNIAKSSIDVSQGGNRSGTNSLGSSEYSGITPPRTPTSMFSGSGGANIADLGSENIRVRLYQLATTSKWEDKRYAYLTVTPPPPGRRPNSTLRHGIEKHIIVTRREHNHRDGPGEVIIDEVLGANCFQMVGVKGVMVTIWDDIRGPNGEIGQIGASGGVAGRQRKFLFQTSWVAHANWIFGICSAGR